MCVWLVGVCRLLCGVSAARFPLRGPQRMAFGVPARAFHSPGGEGRARAEEAGSPGMTAAAAPGPRPPAPERPTPLPARLGGGAHSSSSSSSNGGDSSGAPGRNGLRAFQRVWTSMPAGSGRGRGLGARGRTGRGAQLSGAGTALGSHGSSRRPVLFVAVALGRVGWRARPRAGGLDLGPRGGRDPARLARPGLPRLLRLLLASSSPPPPPPRDSLPVGAALE